MVPPLEAAPAWLEQLTVGDLHTAMAVCTEWQRLARQDVRFHRLCLRAGDAASFPRHFELTAAQAARLTDAALSRCLTLADGRLTRLTLDSLPTITHAALKPLRSLPRLEHVSITNCRNVSDAVCELLPPSVRSAELLGSGVSRDGLHALLERRPGLQLDLRACKRCDRLTHDSFAVRCRSCPAEFCEACDDVYVCGGCRTYVCEGCSDPFHCQPCNHKFCGDCAPLPTTCLVCADQMCEGCGDALMLECTACGGPFCQWHDHVSCDCGCAPAVCLGCEPAAMVWCPQCEAHLYAPLHAFATCSREGCGFSACAECADAYWFECAGCGKTSCPLCIQGDAPTCHGPENCRETNAHCASRTPLCPNCMAPPCEQCKACIRASDEACAACGAANPSARLLPAE